MTHIFTHRWTSAPGSPNYCRAAVHQDRWGFSQCNRKPVVFRCVDGHEGELGFCRQHDPVEVEAREKARRAKWEAERQAAKERRQRLEQEEAAYDACLAALDAIAKGHNDPRTLAAETLGLFPKDKE